MKIWWEVGASSGRISYLVGVFGIWQRALLGRISNRLWRAHSSKHILGYFSSVLCGHIVRPYIAVFIYFETLCGNHRAMREPRERTHLVEFVA